MTGELQLLLYAVGFVLGVSLTTLGVLLTAAAEDTLTTMVGIVVAIMGLVIVGKTAVVP